MHELIAYAAKHGILVDFLPMQCKGISLQYDGLYFIGVSDRLPAHMQRDVILHELGHCMTGSFYHESDSDEDRIRKEHNAIAWAMENRDSFADMV